MTNVHGFDRDKGLDLILHTPGGDLAAARKPGQLPSRLLGTNIIAFVPHLSMSAGTMIACSCKEIYMGRQSAIGPTDPQFGGVAAGGVIEEFNRAVRETTDNPGLDRHVGPDHRKVSADISGRLPKGGRGVAEDGRGMAEDQYAFDLRRRRIQKQEYRRMARTHANSAMHNRHITADVAEKRGLVIRRLEEDSELQDIVLTIHHAYMATFERSGAKKMIENSNGKSWIRIVS